MSGRTSLKKRSLRTLGVVAAMAVPVSLGALEIDWFTIDGGGGRSIAGNLALTGTIAQPDAGPMAGDGFSVRGGFWAASGETVTDAEPAPGVGIPAAFGLSTAAPNPFRAAASLRFDLPRPCHTTVKVYDIAGRLVTTLVDDDREAGSHEVTWRGLDRNGRRVASGVYLVRMQSGTFGATRKITRLE
jgi:hypothetical protein